MSILSAYFSLSFNQKCLKALTLCNSIGDRLGSRDSDALRAKLIYCIVHRFPKYDPIVDTIRSEIALCSTIDDLMRLYCQMNDKYLPHLLKELEFDEGAYRVWSKKTIRHLDHTACESDDDSVFPKTLQAHT